MAEILMPILGADMTEGTLVAWRKQPGERVQRGDIVAEIEMDKGIIEIEAFANGIIDKILIAPGTTVPVGTVLAVLSEDDGASPAPSPPASVPAAQPAPAPQPPPPPVAAAVHGAAARPRVSPLARRVAEELGVDLAGLNGSGPGGAIERTDVERAAATRRASKSEDRQAAMRRAIAAAMARSKREVPHYYLGTTVDMQPAVAWLAAANRERPPEARLLCAALLLKAVALALREVPELNARWEGDSAVPGASVHVGVAIALRGGGLVAPAIHDTDRLDLDELMRRFLDLVQRARSGTLRASELTDPTITVTSLGERGVETVYPIIYPPQVAIVGFGAMVERPWVVAGQVVPRQVLAATLAADHRVSDGHRGALLLGAIERRLAQPAAL